MHRPTDPRWRSVSRIASASLALACMVVMAPSAAQGEIVSFDLLAATNAVADNVPFEDSRQRIDRSTLRFPIDTNRTPVQAVSVFDVPTFDESESLGSLVVVEALARAPFADGGPRPNDFSLQMIGLTRPGGQSPLSLSARAQQLRRIRMSPAEAGVGVGQTTQLDGSVFLDGFVALVANRRDSLDGLQATFRVRTTRRAGRGDGSAATDDSTLVQTGLLLGEIRLVGQGGSVRLEATGAFEGLGLRVEEAAFGDLGTIFYVDVLQLLGLRYEVTVGQLAVLTTSIELESSVLPDGTGVLAVFGDSPLELLGLVEQLGGLRIFDGPLAWRSPSADPLTWLLGEPSASLNGMMAPAVPARARGPRGLRILSPLALGEGADL